MTKCNWCPTGRATHRLQGKPTCHRCLDIVKRQGDHKKLSITEINTKTLL